MRVAIIAPPWLPVPPTGYGGTERVLDDLCRALEAAGHQVLLFTTGDATCPVERACVFERALGTDAASAVAELRHVVEAYDVARAWGAEVVHDHTMSGPFYAAQFPDLPVVTTNHGPFLSDLGPIYAAMPDRVALIAISHHQASTARNTRIAAVIHHGVDIEALPAGAGLGGYGLFMGRMCPEKGVDAAVRIARRAGMPLRIAAKLCEPTEWAYFRERVEPLLGGDVSYVGEVGGAEKIQLLGGATCLVNPISWPEPFGMVMVEALACGTPVIGYPCGAASEIVDHGVTGYLGTDEADLAAAWTRVDTLDRSQCRRVAATRFSAERMAREHIGVYGRARDQTTTRVDGRAAGARGGSRRAKRPLRPRSQPRSLPPSGPSPSPVAMTAERRPNEELIQP